MDRHLPLALSTCVCKYPDRSGDVATHGLWCMRTQWTEIYLHRNYNQKVRRGELLYLTKVRKPILMKHSNIRIETVAWLPAADTATASEWGSIILPSFPWDPASLGSSATFAITYIELQTNHRQSFRNHGEGPYQGLPWLKVPSKAFTFIKTLC